MRPDQIESALAEDRLLLVLQPVVDAQSRRPAFYEALARIKEPDGTVTCASAFVEDAEHAGLVERIDRRTLQLAIGLLGNETINLSLNVSSLTTSDFAWVSDLAALTQGQCNLGRRLIVEITETCAISDINRTLAFVDALRELGCRIAIDDYGAGHTGFTNLNLLAPDIVKIDRAITSRIKEPNARSFVEAIVELSHTLNFESVAEGIESEAEAHALANIGVTYLQGYYFGEPQSPQLALVPRD